jgi:hypothetical protein
MGLEPLPGRSSAGSGLRQVACNANAILGFRHLSYLNHPISDGESYCRGPSGRLEVWDFFQALDLVPRRCKSRP